MSMKRTIKSVLLLLLLPTLQHWRLVGSVAAAPSNPRDDDDNIKFRRHRRRQLTTKSVKSSSQMGDASSMMMMREMMAKSGGKRAGIQTISTQEPVVVTSSTTPSTKFPTITTNPTIAAAVAKTAKQAKTSLEVMTKKSLLLHDSQDDNAAFVFSSRLAPVASRHKIKSPKKGASTEYSSTYNFAALFPHYAATSAKSTKQQQQQQGKKLKSIKQDSLSISKSAKKTFQEPTVEPSDSCEAIAIGFTGVSQVFSYERNIVEVEWPPATLILLDDDEAACQNDEIQYRIFVGAATFDFADKSLDELANDGSLLETQSLGQSLRVDLENTILEGAADVAVLVVASLLDGNAAQELSSVSRAPIVTKVSTTTPVLRSDLGQFVEIPLNNIDGSSPFVLINDGTAFVVSATGGGDDNNLLDELRNLQPGDWISTVSSATGAPIFFQVETFLQDSPEQVSWSGQQGGFRDVFEQIDFHLTFELDPTDIDENENGQSLRRRLQEEGAVELKGGFDRTWPKVSLVGGIIELTLKTAFKLFLSVDVNVDYELVFGFPPIEINFENIESTITGKFDKTLDVKLQTTLAERKLADETKPIFEGRRRSIRRFIYFIPIFVSWKFIFEGFANINLKADATSTFTFRRNEEISLSARTTLDGISTGSSRTTIENEVDWSGLQGVFSASSSFGFRFKLQILLYEGFEIAPTIEASVGTAVEVATAPSIFPAAESLFFLQKYDISASLIAKIDTSLNLVPFLEELEDAFATLPLIEAEDVREALLELRQRAERLAMATLSSIELLNYPANLVQLPEVEFKGDGAVDVCPVGRPDALLEFRVTANEKAPSNPVLITNELEEPFVFQFFGSVDGTVNYELVQDGKSATISLPTEARPLLQNAEYQISEDTIYFISDVRIPTGFRVLYSVDADDLYDSQTVYAAQCCTNDDCNQSTETCISNRCSNTTVSVCGDTVCDTTETVSSCPEDCDTCGNGFCGVLETSDTCPEDCTFCGDGVCESGEDIGSCPIDCGTCGNGICDDDENSDSCPSDCSDSSCTTRQCGSQCVTTSCCPNQRDCGSSCVPINTCCPEERYCDPPDFPTPPRTRGDPFLRNFVGTIYECNAAGEFILLRSDDNTLSLQARFEDIGDSASVSVTTGIALRDTTYPTTQLSISKVSDASFQIGTCDVDFFVDGTLQSGSEYSSFNTFDVITVGGIFSLERTTSNSVTLTNIETRLSFRITVIEVGAFGCYFVSQALFYPISYGLGSRPGYLSEQSIFGLLGSPYNLRVPLYLRDGTAASATALPRNQEAYDFCTQQHCVEDQSDSAFAYEAGTSFATFFQCNVPYRPIDFTSVDQEITDLCGTNQECLVDGLFGGLEAANENVQSQLDDALEDEGLTVRRGLSVNPRTVPPFSETPVTISVILQPGDFQGQRPSFFSLYSVKDGVPAVSSFGTLSFSGQTSEGIIFSSVFNFVSESNGEVFGHIAVPAWGVDGVEDAQSPLLQSDFSTIRVLETSTSPPSIVPSQSQSPSGVPSPLDWVQLGPDLDGEAIDNSYGFSVSISSDGRTVAIGAPGNDGNGSESGHVRIYTYNDNSATWLQLGSDLDGEASGDASGNSVSLSSDGRTVAIGAPGNDGNGSDSGHVRIFTYNDSSAAWLQLGSELNGEASDDSFGWSVSLSSDGGTVAVGARGNDGNGSESGHVRIYTYNDNSATWLQLGSDLDGEASGDASGNSVSLSSDGRTVAIGAPGNDGNGSKSGHVRIYTYNDSTGGWLQLGSDLDGEAHRDNSGNSLSLSSDGRTVAIGAPYYDLTSIDLGHVRIFTYNDSSEVWLQLGSELNGEATNDIFGWSVSLSADGRTVAIGAPWNDGNCCESGHVRIYTYNDSSATWLQVGSDLDGEASDDRSGGSVSLSSDGRTVAVGARYNDGTGSNSGHVRVYTLDVPSSLCWSQLGSDLDGENSVDQSGFSVSLSSDGHTVAIGAPTNDGNGSQSGHVRIYTYNDSSGGWFQLGSDLDGEASGDSFGLSVSLSSDGRTVAIGADGNDGNGGGSGHVRLYTYNDSSGGWLQLGSDLDGEASGDVSGTWVSLSSDGRTVAIGAPGNDGNGSGSGHVRIYTYNDSSSAWIQLGSDLDGEAIGDVSGNSVSLSSDGRTVAIGAPGNDGNGTGSGHVRIYTYNDSSATWLQLGSDLDGEASGDSFGRSLSLSSDGRTVAIGAFLNDGNGIGSGHVRIYTYNGSWIQLGSDLDGEASGDGSGLSVSLSSDGRTVAIGAYLNDGSGTDSGHIRIYTYNDSSATWLQQGSDLDGEASGDSFGRSVSLSSDGGTVAAGAFLNSGNGLNSGHVRVYSFGAC